MSSDSINTYRRLLWDFLRPRVEALGPLERVLDFGSGDGWFSAQVGSMPSVGEVVSIDLQRRPNSHVEPRLYDGSRLPFEDRSFDLVMTFDVVHHSPTPLHSLIDLLRCSARHALIKDHTYRTPVGWLALAVLDEAGNRRFGIPSRYHYQRRFEWDEAFTGSGFGLEWREHPVRVQPGALGAVTNHLQYVALWTRDEPAA